MAAYLHARRGAGSPMDGSATWNASFDVGSAIAETVHHEMRRAGGLGRVHIESIWYSAVMTKDQVKEILDRVLTWPPKRQEDAVRVLTEMEEQDASPYRLTDERVAEVHRRRADFAAGRERYATDEEMAALWKKCGL
jgi:hypothetical protein